MACHRRKAPSPAWGTLYSIVAAALGGLALGEAFAPDARLRLIADSVGVLLLFGGMRLWVGVNWARLVLDRDALCCTSRLLLAGDAGVYSRGGMTEHRPDPDALVARIAEEEVRQRRWPPYLWAAGIVAIASGVAWVAFPVLELANLIMIYLLGIVVVAMRHGRGPSLLASLLSVAAFDFFFVPPYFTFAVVDVRYAITFLVMFVVALVISGLTVRMRAQAAAARQREQRTSALYAMSRELASTRGVDALLRIAARHTVEVFRCQVVLLLPETGGRLVPRNGVAAQFEPDASELAVSQWAYEHRQPAGLGTDTLPGASALYLPLLGSRGPVGVLGVRPPTPHAFDSPDQLHQLETFANQTALAIERAQLADESQEARLRIEAERLRSTLLSSVSHDLKTPLAAITGAAGTLLEEGARLDPGTREELLQSVYEEADRLTRLVQNLLEMTRLESGALELRKEWHSMEEVIGAALSRLKKRLGDRPVYTRVPPDLPLVAMDDVLIEQVLLNLLDNALKYTPSGSPISITATATDQAVYVEVADHGPGLPPGEETRIFEKFYRASAPTSRGTGLGLAICRGVIRAHGGRIWAQNLPEGGVAFFFSLPITEAPPAVVTDG